MVPIWCKILRKSLNGQKSLNDFHSSSPQTHLSGYLQRQENEYIKKKYNFNTMYMKFHKK